MNVFKGITMDPTHSKHACRSCKQSTLSTFLDLGQTPIADGLVKPENLDQTDPLFPLEAAFCNNCGMVQILETVDPSILFSSDYPYFSSFSDQLLAHSKANVEEVLREVNLNDQSLVVELASNDGYLLQYYVEQGIPVLGIDPADGPAKVAQERGVKTLHDFFSLELAHKLKDQGTQADIIHANNVLAHVADTSGFVEGIATLLKDDGVAVIEAPYAKALIDHLEFDTIYHQHLLYLTVTALDYLFRAHGLYLNRVKQLNIHGGSLRLFVEKHENVQSSVTEMLRLEHLQGVDTLDYYQGFSRRVNELKAKLYRLLTELKLAGYSIAGYGAAAKGCTLMSYVGIDSSLIDFIADKNIHKQGLYTPGNRIEIISPDRILEAMPDYLVIFPWNFSSEIICQQAEYHRRGGRFIIPIPEPEII
jgi:2-polyprenyl-3-methyl-5-hydroxy-6-metoxy-1,4-benzoquinol methylase